MALERENMPSAESMRPKSLDSYLGQTYLIGTDSILLPFNFTAKRLIYMSFEIMYNGFRNLNYLLEYYCKK